MARYNVDVSEPAESDLLDIVRYISARLNAPMTALGMIDAIEEALADLTDMPYKHSLVADERLAALGYRKLHIKNYIAYFTIDEKEATVNVERILYARRDWLRLL